jgi:hypothetical protein
VAIGRQTAAQSRADQATGARDEDAHLRMVFRPKGSVFQVLRSAIPLPIPL